MTKGNVAKVVCGKLQTYDADTHIILFGIIVIQLIILIAIAVK